jgi:hypothetical protein
MFMKLSLGFLVVIMVNSFLLHLHEIAISVRRMRELFNNHYQHLQVHLPEAHASEIPEI